MRFLKIYAVIFLNLRPTNCFDWWLDTGENEIKTMLQPVDHFDTNETRSWNMTYIQNIEYWKPNGPIYINIGGAGPCTVQINFFKEGFFLYDLVKETNGALFGFEHRYYGSSTPLSITKTENLIYLNSKQALADLATLIKYVKSTLKAENSKVVVVGGSRIGNAGNLAAWMRLLYSDIVDAAVSDSAPVLAKADFKDFFEIVGEDFSKYGTPDCYDKISQMFTRFQTLLSTPEGIKQLKKEQSICNFVDMTLKENQQVFFEYYLDNFIVSTLVAPDVDYFQLECDNNFTAYGIQWFELEILPSERNYVTWDDEGWCINLDFYQLFDRKYKDCYLYQQCTEFGSFPSTESGKHPFTNSLPVEYYYKACKVQFGPEFGKKKVEDGVKATNEMYGGLHPNVTKVVFVNGEFDPWRKLGITENLSDDAPAFVVAKSGRSQLLMSPNMDADSEELKEARKKVKSLIKKWIGL